MKALAIAAGLAIFLGGATAKALDRSEEAVRSGQRLAAMMAAKKILSDLPGMDLAGLNRVWAAEILRDPGRHARVAESRQLLLAEYDRRLRQTLREQLRRVHAGFNPGGRDRWFSEAWLRTQIEKGFEGQIEQGIARNAGTRFGGHFQAARRSATQEQLRRISAVAYPTVTEVEGLARAAWPPAQQEQLAETLVVRMSRQTILLEETALALRRSAAGAIHDARTQLESQSEALTRPVSEKARTAEDIAVALRAAVEQVRQQWRAAGRSRHIYGMFPTVETRLAQRARAVEKGKFRDFCLRFPAGVSEVRLRTMIEGDLRNHQSRVASDAILLEILLPEIATRAAEQYAAGLGDPGRAATFRIHLNRLAIEDSELQATMRAHLEKELVLPLKRVRNAIAEAQLTHHFPGLASGQWMPAEASLQKLGLGEPVVSSFDECLSLPEIVADRQSLDISRLLDETREKVYRLTLNLLQEGKTAWDAQNSVVSTKIKPEIPPTIQAKRTERTVEEWQHHFIHRAEDMWSQEQGSVWRKARDERIASLHAPSKYRRLFYSLEEDIRACVKNQYEVKEETPSQTLPTPVPDPTESTPAPGTPLRNGENSTTEGPVQPSGVPSLSFSLPIALLLLLVIALVVLLLRFLLRSPRRQVSSTGAQGSHGASKEERQRKGRWRTVLFVLALLALLLLALAGLGRGGAGRKEGGGGGGKECPPCPCEESGVGTRREAQSLKDRISVARSVAQR